MCLELKNINSKNLKKFSIFKAEHQKLKSNENIEKSCISHKNIAVLQFDDF